MAYIPSEVQMLNQLETTFELALKHEHYSTLDSIPIVIIPKTLLEFLTLQTGQNAGYGPAAQPCSE
jgi:hypothetical protein